MQIMMHLLGIEGGEEKSALPAMETGEEDGDFADLLLELAAPDTVEWPAALVPEIGAKPVTAAGSHVLQAALASGFPPAAQQAAIPDAAREVAVQVVPPVEPVATQAQAPANPRASVAAGVRALPTGLPDRPAGSAFTTVAASPPQDVRSADPASAPLARGTPPHPTAAIPMPVSETGTPPIPAVAPESATAARPVAPADGVPETPRAARQVAETPVTPASAKPDRPAAPGFVSVMRPLDALPPPAPARRTAPEITLPAASAAPERAAATAVVVAPQPGAETRRASVARTLTEATEPTGEAEPQTPTGQRIHAGTGAEPPTRPEGSNQVVAPVVEERQSRQRADLPPPAPADRGQIASADARPAAPAYAPVQVTVAREVDSGHGALSEAGDLPLSHASDPVETRRGSDTHAPRAAETPVRPVVAQIVQALKAGGDSVVEVRLSPEELGRVRLSMTPADTGMTVQISTERPETLELLRRNIEVLASDLARQGFSDLNFSFRQEREAPQHAPRGGPFGQEDGAAQVAAPRAAHLPLRPHAATDGHIDIRL